MNYDANIIFIMSLFVHFQDGGYFMKKIIVKNMVYSCSLSSYYKNHIYKKCDTIFPLSWTHNGEKLYQQINNTAF